MSLSPREFVKSWLAQNNAIFSPTGNLYIADCPGKKASSIRAALVLDASEEARASKSKFESTMLDLALGELAEEAAAAHRADLLKSIECSTEDLSPLSDWVTAVTGTCDSLDLKAMAHFVWSVKRKASGLQVGHHLMPVLYGRQGSGKSRAVERLLEPLKNFTLDLDLSQLEDKSFLSSFENNLVGFADELAGAKRAEISTLKRIITASHFSVRKLYTSIVDKIPNNVSLIAASNRPVDSLIFDDEMRRYYQLTTATRCDWVAINTLNIMALWRGVDEKRETGYVGDESTLSQLRKAQTALATSDDVSLFIDDVRASNTTLEILAQEFYKQYSHWALERGFKPSDAARFGKRVKGLGVQVESRGKAHKKFYVIRGQTLTAALALLPKQPEYSTDAL